MKKKLITCMTLILMSAMASAQSYIQVDRSYSGSGVNKTLTLTIRNLSDKEMGIRNQDVSLDGSYLEYMYLNNNRDILYSSSMDIMEGKKILTFIPPKSSKSYIYKIGSQARYTHNVNQSEVKYIQLHFYIKYGIPGLKYSNIFNTTVSVTF